MPVFVLAASGLTACDSGNPDHPHWSFQGKTMGTTYHVSIVNPPVSINNTDVEDEIIARLEKVNSQMSTYRADSDLSRFNYSTATNWVPVPGELHTVVDAAKQVTSLTGGAFDVTVGPLVNLWGFGPGTEGDRVPGTKEIQRVRQRVGDRHLATRSSPPALRKDRPDVYVDLSAIAKGYAVDVLASYLEDLGITNYLVEIGGEVRTGGFNRHGQPWQIAVEQPVTGRRVIHRIIDLSDLAMATSGDYRNYFEKDGQRYSHTIDPRTGSPVRHYLASVTVVADSTMFADAMATALTVLGPDAGYVLAEGEGIAALFLVRDGDVFVEKFTSSFNRESTSRVEIAPVPEG